MKKKFMLFVMLIILCISLTACKKDIEVKEYNSFKYQDITNMVYAFEDQDTGVWYISNRRGGITPRLNSDGSLYITK